MCGPEWMYNVHKNDRCCLWAICKVYLYDVNSELCSIFNQKHFRSSSPSLCLGLPLLPPPRPDGSPSGTNARYRGKFPPK